MISKTNIQRAAVAAPNVAGARDFPASVKLDIVHHVPGRLRLRSASLKGDAHARAREETRRHLAAVRGVTSVTANPCTGSLVVKYDAALLPPSNIIDVLASHGYMLTVADKGIEPDGEWAGPLASAVKEWMISAVAERLVLALIGALA